MKLKKWVKTTLVIIWFISLLIMASECDNDIIFVISHFIALGICVGTMKLLMSY